MDKVLNDKRMNPEVVKCALQFQVFANRLLKPLGGYWLWCQGFRERKYQAQLYSIGRTTQKNRKPVTNAPPGHSYHEYGMALDGVPVIKGKVAWDRLDLFKKIGKLAIIYGLSWAGNFKNSVAKWDLGHFEKNFGLTIADLESGKKPKEV